jgi:hypothetical protein
MNRAIKIISEIPANKAGIKLFADAVVSGIMDGETDPLDVRAKIDAIEKIIKAIKDDVAFKDAVLDQADLYPDKTFELNNIKFTKAESAKYDYSDDEIWNDLKEKETEAAEARKSEEELLKTLKEPTEVNGVLRHPPFKKSTSYVRVTFG